VSEAQLKFFKENGYVVLPNVVDNKRCEDFVDELWGVLEAVPRVKGMEIKRPHDPHGEVSASWLKQAKARWVPHAQFGAPCEPPMFHLNTMWQVRQDPRLYDFYKKLLGRSDLWVGINRPIIRLPGQGQAELCHWDQDPFFWDNDGDAATGGLHSIVAFSDTTVALSSVPTFTQEFTDQFRKQYGHLRKPKPQAKIQVKAPDPMYLMEEKNWQEIPVPKGSVIIWSAKLLHSAAVNRSKRIRYGMYLGYRPAGSRPNMSNTDLALDELQDRLRSYRTGCMPFRYPSGDPTHYMPARWLNFPKIAAAYQRRLPEPQASQTRVIASGLNKGRRVPALYEPDPQGYQPPVLTPLGRKLLGLDQWTEADLQAGAGAGVGAGAGAGVGVGAGAGVGIGVGVGAGAGVGALKRDREEPLDQAQEPAAQSQTSSEEHKAPKKKKTKRRKTQWQEPVCVIDLSAEESSSASIPASADAASKCVLCLDKEKVMALVPCGHIVFCVSCAPSDRLAQLETCPLCRTEVNGVLRVYV
jgi:hypothetical protein